jgi:cytochrome c-type biogenesis protein CcmE
MKSQRKKRLLIILFIICGVSVALGLSLYALSQNVDLYYTPTQLLNAGLHNNRIIRIGGMVEKGSVHFAEKGLQVSFVLTDYSNAIPIEYNGVLPALFREGQGIVAQGKLNQQGIFVANEVLAKHDAKYRPPGLDL